MIGAPIVQLISSLKNSERPHDLLLEIKSALHVMKKTEVKRQLNSQSQQLTTIVDYLIQSVSEEEKRICISILNVCVHALDPDVIYTSFETFFVRGLDSNDENINTLTLEAINVASSSVRHIPSILSNPDLTSALITNTRKELAVSKVACSTLKKLILQAADQDLGVNDQIKTALRRCSDTDVTKLRIYELLVQICVQSPKAFDMLSEWEMFDVMVSESVTDDILVQLNTLFVLGELASCEHGFNFLCKKGVFDKLADVLDNINENPMKGLLLPGLFKFFGGVCFLKPTEMITKHPAFMKCLFEELNTSDSVTIETLGFICRSSAVKLSMNEKSEFRRTALPLLSSMCKSPDTVKRCLGFSSLRQMFSCSDERSGRMSAILQNWWNALDLPFESIVEMLSQPFEDIKIEIHGLISALSWMQWAVDLMRNCGGFIEYILGRQTNLGRGTVLSKYDTVCVLADSPVVRQTFGDPIYVKLQTYKSCGPYYSIPDVQVAVERS